MGWISLEGDDANLARRHRKMVKHKCSEHGLSKYMMRLFPYGTSMYSQVGAMGWLIVANH